MGWKPGWMLAAVVALAAAALFAILRTAPAPRPPRTSVARVEVAPPPPAPSPAPAPPQPAPPPSRPAQAIDAVCGGAPAFAAAAAANTQSLTTLAWAPFGRAEMGWAVYAPLIAHEIGTTCAPGQPGFAAALSRWQAARKLPADGRLTEATFETMRVLMLRRRPFVVATARGVCPPGPDESALAPASAADGYSGKLVRLLPGALLAYRRMVAAARRDEPEIAADKRFLTIFSGYRSPAEAEERCAERGCAGPERARCSAHQTGAALDLYVGAAPNQRPESTDDANRAFQTRTRAYRWLVANAERFGFAPYPFEPWHWEWVGDPAAPPSSGPIGP